MSVIKNEPSATEPIWYTISLLIELNIGELKSDLGLNINFRCYSYDDMITGQVEFKKFLINMKFF